MWNRKLLLQEEIVASYYRITEQHVSVSTTEAGRKKNGLFRLQIELRGRYNRGNNKKAQLIRPMWATAVVMGECEDSRSRQLPGYPSVCCWKRFVAVWNLTISLCGEEKWSQNSPVQSVSRLIFFSAGVQGLWLVSWSGRGLCKHSIA